MLIKEKYIKRKLKFTFQKIRYFILATLPICAALLISLNCVKCLYELCNSRHHSKVSKSDQGSRYRNILSFISTGNILC